MRDLLKDYRVLYVEDEPNIQKSMAEYLEYFFQEVIVASNGKEGLEAYHQYGPDVLILDVDMPVIDGLSMAQTIRKTDKKISIIMLTAFTDHDKLLHATELKLLKYVVKPIDLLEFQKTLDMLALELIENAPDTLVLGYGYIWHISSQKLTHENNSVALTAKEQKLMTLLVKNKNQSVTFEDIMANVWEDEFDKEISLNSVKNIVSNLRKNLPDDCIKNVYGKGYMFQ